jgi:hypothetical protein
MTFSLVPACNEPTVTTAASAITTGSMLACGMKPCRRARRTTHRLVLGGGRSSNNGTRTGDCATTLFTGYRCESEGWKRIGPVAIFFAGQPSGHHSIRVFETLTIRLPDFVGCSHRDDFDHLGCAVADDFLESHARA